jgi:hypothetical protein
VKLVTKYQISAISFNIVSADFHKKEIDIDVLFQRAKKRKLEDLGSDDESGPQKYKGIVLLLEINIEIIFFLT